MIGLIIELYSLYYLFTTFKNSGDASLIFILGILMMALGIGSSTCFRIASSGVDINGADSSLLGISIKLEKT